jgi:hypothetical protein
MGQTGPAFQKFPGISAVKVKDGVFIGPQIRKLFRDKQFHRILSCNGKRAWYDFWLLATNFMGNNKADNYNKRVENVLSSQKLGCNMSLKIFFLHYHQDIFPENYGALNDEHGECFITDISALQNTYQCTCSSWMSANYCWTVTRASPGLTYKRQAKRQHN